MSIRTEDLIAQIRTLERDLEAELASQRTDLGLELKVGRARFASDVVERHKAARIHLAKYIFNARPLIVLVSPIIYSLIIPFLLVDLWACLFQAICFRVYAIPQVQRSRYMIFDRAALQYLNALEKLNCAYCSYVNGVIAYVREIASRTGQYWCPIKHARRVLGAHPRYAAFEEYGDGVHYQARLRTLRVALSGEPPEKGPA